MDFIDLNQYIQPDLLILIPVLIVLGKIIKNSFVNNKHIPLILGVLSIILSCTRLIVINNDNFSHAIITGFIQGILIAGASVYGNQIFKQYSNDKNDKSE